MAGLEPATPRIRGELSNQLSYTLLLSQFHHLSDLRLDITSLAPTASVSPVHFIFYQDSGARTRDPSAPDRALYQLSYILLYSRLLLFQARYTS